MFRFWFGLLNSTVESDMLCCPLCWLPLVSAILFVFMGWCLIASEDGPGANVSLGACSGLLVVVVHVPEAGMEQNPPFSRLFFAP